MSENYVLPVVPVRGLVVFPNMSLNFDVGRKLDEMYNIGSDSVN